MRLPRCRYRPVIPTVFGVKKLFLEVVKSTVGGGAVFGMVRVAEGSRKSPENPGVQHNTFFGGGIGLVVVADAPVKTAVLWVRGVALPVGQNVFVFLAEFGDKREIHGVGKAG